MYEQILKVLDDQCILDADTLADEIEHVITSSTTEDFLNLVSQWLAGADVFDRDLFVDGVRKLVAYYHSKNHHLKATDHQSWLDNIRQQPISDR